MLDDLGSVVFCLASKLITSYRTPTMYVPITNAWIEYSTVCSLYLSMITRLALEKYKYIRELQALCSNTYVYIVDSTSVRGPECPCQGIDCVGDPDCTVLHHTIVDVIGEIF